MPLQRTLACVTGRFQPFHRDHLWLVAHAAALAEHVIVAITNPDPRSRLAHPDSDHRHLDASNPFGYRVRARMVTAALLDAGIRDFDVVPFPLEAPQTWPSYVPLEALHLVRAYTPWERAKAGTLRDHGYEVLLLEGDLDSRITATQIRESIACGRDEWRALVPDAVARTIDRIGVP